MALITSPGREWHIHTLPSYNSSGQRKPNSESVNTQWPISATTQNSTGLKKKKKEDFKQTVFLLSVCLRRWWQDSHTWHQVLPWLCPTWEISISWERAMYRICGLECAGCLKNSSPWGVAQHRHWSDFRYKWNRACALRIGFQKSQRALFPQLPLYPLIGKAHGAFVITYASAVPYQAW